MSDVERLTTMAECKSVTDDLICITQDLGEQKSASAQDCLAICIVKATRLATSIYCTGTGCGGHPICQPCYDLMSERDLLTDDPWVADDE